MIIAFAIPVIAVVLIILIIRNRRKSIVVSKSLDSDYEPIPLCKGLVYQLGGVLALIAFLLYLVFKQEIGFQIPTLIYLPIFGLLIWFYSKMSNTRISFQRSVNSKLGTTLIATYKKRKNQSK
jgi:hypothetical protein